MSINIDPEKKLLDAIIGVHHTFIDMPRIHPSELADWVNAIHNLQRIIATRIASIEHPEIFYIENHASESKLVHWEMNTDISNKAPVDHQTYHYQLNYDRRYH